MPVEYSLIGSPAIPEPTVDEVGDFTRSRVGKLEPLLINGSVDIHLLVQRANEPEQTSFASLDETVQRLGRSDGVFRVVGFSLADQHRRAVRNPLEEARSRGIVSLPESSLQSWRSEALRR